MSRTGVEAKLPWKYVPQTVRQQVETVLGASVVRARRVWGGYAPTPTFRLSLADGRRAFFKGTFENSNTFSKNALLYEERVYRELAPLLKNYIPQLYATLRDNDWHCLLLEDVGPKSVPPWTTQKTREVAYGLAAFHQSSLGSSPPAWLARPAAQLKAANWTRAAQESDGFLKIAALAGAEAAQALNWFQHISTTIQHFMAKPTLYAEPYAILHGDLRSDNLRINGGRLYLFDWPEISVGRPEWDIVAFAQSVTVENGPLPEQVISWYSEKLALDSAAIDCALAWLLTFFAERAWRPEISGLPRLRRFQRQQLGTIILWLARRWSLPTPKWTSELLQ